MAAHGRRGDGRARRGGRDPAQYVRRHRQCRDRRTAGPYAASSAKRPACRRYRRVRRRSGRKQLAALPGVLRVVEQDHKSRLLDAPPLVLFVEEAAGNVTPFPSSPAEAAARAATRDRTFPPFHIDGFRRARPVLKVQDGCSHGCAYCIVPLTRGPARSRPPRDCLAEMRRLLEAGYREIMISGINLRQYAMRDEGCRDFWDLLSYLDRELSPEWGSGARPDPARFRISSVEPAQLTERGIATLAETRMVCPHLHLSLQSGERGRAEGHAPWALYAGGAAFGGGGRG